MAKIPLRAYNREIENLVNRGQIDEAVGHCIHILRFFPKHIDTYRLLGKAYLEGQHYAEASDVLQRVLSCVPDDFVSQIGMSIIREDEGNLDAAIWHMERAFEVQPANTAVQGELRRLYGRRDGIEPPKVRLTRGALVRMYARGELYQQAIAEIRAALAEDPKRIDIEVILAQMYFLSGMKVEATEICSRIITKLPFCFEANRILAEILPDTTRAEDAKAYQQRVDAMEPYIAYLSKNTPTLADVPDNVVTLDRLEWQASEATTQKPEWARTVGIEWEEQQESLPEWMASSPEAFSADLPMTPAESNLPDSEKPVFEQPETSPQGSETLAENEEGTIPDWMKAAGWGKSTGPEVPPSESAFVEDETSSAEISSGDIPDWLQAMAPQESTEENAASEDQSRLDLLASLLPESQAPVADQNPTAQISPTTEAEAALPDWMKTEGDIPAELSFGSTADETPDWLKSAQAAAEPPTGDLTGAETPAWMNSESSQLETSASDSPKEETPDWLKALASSEEVSQPAENPTSEMPDWLKSEELIAPEATRQPVTPVSASLPSEIADIQPSVENEQPVTPIPAQPAAAPVPENPDDAFAWLEALATRQGAAEETLLTKPEDRSETPPDWLQQAAPSEEPAVVSPEPVTGQVEATPEDLESEVPDWLKEFQSETSAEPSVATETPQSEPAAVEPVETPAFELSETTQPAAEADAGEEIPDWLKPVSEETEKAFEPETPAASVEAAAPLEEPQPQEPAASELPTPEMTGADADSAFAWLEALAAKQGADEETLLVKPEERLETPPDWVQQQMSEPQPEPESTPAVPEEVQLPAAAEPESAAELPEWLAAKDEAVESGAAPQARIPDWLKDSSEPVAEPEAQETPAVEIPDWLKSSEPQAEETTLAAAETPAEQTPAETAETPAMNADDGFAWLESLAAKQGAEEETLLLKPEDRIEQPPEWVAEQAAAEQPSEPIAEPQPVLEETPVSSTEEPAETVEETPAEEIPDWLKDLEISSEEADAAIDLAFVHPAGHAESAAVTSDAVNAWMQEQPETGAAEATKLPAAETSGEITHPVPVAPIPEKVPIPEPMQELTTDVQTVLGRARTALNRGKTQEAVGDYLALIQRRQALDETIQDLKDALYQHPVDIDLWQTIGDAYAHSNRLQDALDSYTKAEELLR